MSLILFTLHDTDAPGNFSCTSLKRNYFGHLSLYLPCPLPSLTMFSPCWWSVNNLASLVTQMVKSLLAMQKRWVQSLCWEHPPNKGKTTHSSILAGDSCGQRSLMGVPLWLQTVGHNWVVKHTNTLPLVPLILFLYTEETTPDLPPVNFKIIHSNLCYMPFDWI